jgi:hypothetical protein
LEHDRAVAAPAQLRCDPARRPGFAIGTVGGDHEICAPIIISDGAPLEDAAERASALLECLHERGPIDRGVFEPLGLEGAPLCVDTDAIERHDGGLDRIESLGVGESQPRLERIADDRRRSWR